MFSGEPGYPSHRNFPSIKNLMSLQRTFISSRQAAAFVAIATTAVLLLQLAAPVICSFFNPMCLLQLLIS
jgi:hypothetical protein